MIDQYFGTKELYEVVLKANTTMTFGARQVTEGEPVLYFEKVNIAQLTERNTPIMARGGWGNMPRVIWEDRSEMTFQLTEGVMTSVGLGILTSARMVSEANQHDAALYIPQKTGPFYLENDGTYFLPRTPSLNKKIFCYEFSRDTIQKKVDFSIDGNVLKIEEGDLGKTYLLDYYIQYGDEAIEYFIEKERFNGTFSLEAKFYTKDENDGNNTTNLLYMPKTRIVSDINLRLGERADPTISVFSIIAMPTQTEESREMIAKIVRLGVDLDNAE